MLLEKQLASTRVTGTMPVQDAKAKWLEHRLASGYKAYAPLLTPPSANLKFEKTGKHADHIITYGLSLGPARSSGHNVCPFSTPECRRGCVAYSGNGMYPKIVQARIDKTLFLQKEPEAFMSLLSTELVHAHERYGDSLAVRLNTFSDLPWESLFPWLFKMAPIQYYDYVKDWTRVSTPAYHLTYSVSERTKDADIAAALSQGRNTAIVFSTSRSSELPSTYLGFPVVDGDKTDARFKDPQGVIVGLRAKGRMRGTGWKMVRNVG